MATTLYANNVAAVTAADIGPTDTLIVLSAGQGAFFPSLAAGEYCYATLIHPVSHVNEIVRITARSADTLTVERGRDGSTATAFPAGSVMEMRLVAVMLRELDYTKALDQPNGIPVLGADTRLPTSRLPINVVYQTDGKINASLIPNSFATDAEVASAVTAGVADKVNKTGDTMSGALHNYVGAVNTQRVLRRMGANDEKQRYAEAIEADNSYVIYAYDDFGGSATQALILRNAITSGAFINKLTVGGSGDVWTTGTFNPDTKVDRDYGTTFTPRFYRYGFPATEGFTFYGSSGAYIWFTGSNFTFSNWCYSSNFVATSDERLKKSIRKHRTTRGFADQISLSSWEWRKKLRPHNPAGRHTGALAQHVQGYAPHHVSEDGDGYLGVDKAGLAIEGVVDLAARVRDLEASNAELQAMVRKLLKNR